MSPNYLYNSNKVFLDQSNVCTVVTSTLNKYDASMMMIIIIVMMLLS